MKKIILSIIIVLSFSNAYSLDGWIGHQSPVNVNLNDICFINANTGWAVGGNGKIVKTINGGINWTEQNSTTSINLISVCFINENTGWCAGGSRNLFALNFYYILGTTNGGITWDSLHYSVIDQSYIHKIYLKNPNLGFNLGDGGNGGGTQGFLFRSTTFGNTWTSGLTQTHTYMDIVFKDNNTGWLITKYSDDTDHDTATVMKTTNGGNSWNRLFFRNKLNLYTLEFLGSDDILVYGQSYMTGLSGRFILKSSDGGQNWDSTYGALNGNYSNSHFINFNTGWVSGPGGIFRTTDNGVNYEFQLSDPVSSLHFVNFLTGWAAGNGGIVYKTITGGVTGISPIGNNTPESFKLYQNYPNPFNPTTNIKFDISKSGNVKIQIYDLSGKEVSELLNQNLSPGTYETTWDGSGFVSGIYFYTLKGEGIKETRKMLLIK